MSTLSIWLGILEGCRVTASVTLYALLFAVPFGLAFGIAQYLTTGLLNFLVTAIIEFWRGSAVIVLLLVFNCALPVFAVTLSAMTVAAMVLGLDTGSGGWRGDHAEAPEFQGHCPYQPVLHGDA